MTGKNICPRITRILLWKRETGNGKPETGRKKYVRELREFYCGNWKAEAGNREIEKLIFLAVNIIELFFEISPILQYGVFFSTTTL